MAETRGSEVATLVRRRWWLAGALAALCAAGVLRDAWLIFRSPAAAGTDGYYYAVQARHLLSHHELYYPTATPAVLYVIAAGAAVLRDPVTSVKVCSLVLSVALAAGVYGILRASTGQVWCGALGAALISVPIMHLFLVVEFLNNLGALALLAGALWCILRGSESGARGWWLGAAVALAGALLSHRMAWVVAPVVTVLYVVAGRMLSGRSATVRYAVCAAAVAAAWSAAWGLGKLNWPDRVASEFLAAPAFPLRLANPIGTPEMALLLLAAPLAIWMTGEDRSWPSRLRKLATVTALWTLMVTLNPWLNHSMRDQGIAGRIDHVVFLQVAFLIPALLFVGSTRYHRELWLPVAAAAIVLAAASFAPWPYGARREFLAERQRLIEGLAHIRLPPDARVIARHGEEFVVTYTLGVQAAHDYDRAPSADGVYWLVRSGPGEAGQLIAEEDDSRIVLLSHEELTRLDAAGGPGQQRALRANNPHWKRYLDAGNLSGEADVARTRR